MKRKCIALTDGNYVYVNNLVQQKKAKNFSRAINEMIDEKKGDDYVKNGDDNNRN